MSKNFEQLFFFSDFFEFFIKKSIYLEPYSIFFSSFFLPPRRRFKTCSQKNSKKIKKFNFFKKFRTIFFFSDFFEFFIKKCIFLNYYSIFFPSCFFATQKTFQDIFSEKLEKNKKFLICQKISNNFFFQRFFRILYQKMYISRLLLNIFSQLFLCHLEDFLRHILRKTQKN